MGLDLLRMRGAGRTPPGGEWRAAAGAAGGEPAAFRGTGLAGRGPAAGCRGGRCWCCCWSRWAEAAGWRPMGLPLLLLLLLPLQDFRCQNRHKAPLRRRRIWSEVAAWGAACLQTGEGRLAPVPPVLRPAAAAARGLPAAVAAALTAALPRLLLLLLRLLIRHCKLLWLLLLWQQGPGSPGARQGLRAAAGAAGKVPPSTLLGDPDSNSPLRRLCKGDWPGFSLVCTAAAVAAAGAAAGGASGTAGGGAVLPVNAADSGGGAVLSAVAGSASATWGSRGQQQWMLPTSGLIDTSCLSSTIWSMVCCWLHTLAWDAIGGQGMAQLPALIRTDACWTGVNVSGLTHLWQQLLLQVLQQPLALWHLHLLVMPHVAQGLLHLLQQVWAAAAAAAVGSRCCLLHTMPRAYVANSAKQKFLALQHVGTATDNRMSCNMSACEH